MTYFDHNASSPLLPEAKQAWLEASEKFPGNPSSPHRVGARAENALNAAREKLAAIFGCDPFDLVFTSGATESNNAVLQHFARSLDRTNEVWISAIEHPSVIQPAKFYCENLVRLIPANRHGVTELDCIEQNFKKSRPQAVIVMAANNETGVLQPWQQIAALCRSHGVPFFCDATQWLGRVPARPLGQCDFITGSAHKFGGPKGVGFLKVAKDFHALLRGGKQEEGRRAGTENVPGILAMVAALDKCETLLQAKSHEPRANWRNAFEKCLVQKLPGARVIGPDSARLWNTSTVVMPPLADCAAQRRWVVKLDKAGFAVSTGSACASGREEASHVLSAMGFASEESSRVLRFSSGWQTAEADWDFLLEALYQIYSETKSEA